MTDPIVAFFDDLERRGHSELLEEVSGVIRFDLAENNATERWFLDVRNGDLEVSRKDRESDCVIRVDRGLFGEIVVGRANMYAAWLRSRVIFEGNTRLAGMFELTLPGPPGASEPRQEWGRR